MGLFERDIRPKILLKEPKLYLELRSLNILNFYSFCLWVMKALYHSTVVFFIIIGVTWESGSLGGSSHIPFTGSSWLNNSVGQTDGLNCAVVCICLVLNTIITIEACLTITYWSWYTFILIGFSFCCGYVFYIFLNFTFDYNAYFVVTSLLVSYKFYLINLLCIGACFTPEIAIKYFFFFYFPKKWEEMKRKDVTNESFFNCCISKKRLYNDNYAYKNYPIYKIFSIC
jgi:magnesium-transporting ATPase (P-type)